MPRHADECRRVLHQSQRALEWVRGGRAAPYPADQAVFYAYLLTLTPKQAELSLESRIAQWTVELMNAMERGI